MIKHFSPRIGIVVGIGAVVAAAIVPLAIAGALPAGSAAAGTVEIAPTSGDNTTLFSMAPSPAPASCNGSGADGHRWQTFLTPISVDPATLTYNSDGPVPVAGEFTVPMFSGGNPIVNMNPAVSPAGLIVGNPDTYDFAAFVEGFKPPAGQYSVGFACTTGVDTYKFWRTTITISNRGPLFTWTVGTPASTTTTTITTTTTSTTVAPSTSTSTSTTVAPSTSTSTTTTVAPSSTSSTTTVAPSSTSSTTTSIAPSTSSTTTSIAPSTSTSSLPSPSSTSSTTVAPGTTTTLPTQTTTSTTSTTSPMPSTTTSVPGPTTTTTTVPSNAGPVTEFDATCTGGPFRLAVDGVLELISRSRRPWWLPTLVWFTSDGRSPALGIVLRSNTRSASSSSVDQSDRKGSWRHAVCITEPYATKHGRTVVTKFKILFF